MLDTENCQAGSKLPLYEVGKRYYDPEEPGVPVEITEIQGEEGERIFTLLQRFPGEAPINCFEANEGQMSEYREDRRTGVPLSDERAAEIRVCSPEELRVRKGNDPLKEAMIVKAAYDRIMRR